MAQQNKVILPWDQYSEYLNLDPVLTSLKPCSDAAGHPERDERLFIRFHQIYEIWFAQILDELNDLQTRLSAPTIAERQMEHILADIDRINKIMTVIEEQMPVLETMEAQTFVNFREYFGTASGFQSWQFRLIETRLGLRRDERIPVFHGHFDENLKEESRRRIKDAESIPSLFDLIDSWLSRTPFIAWGAYDFRDAYRNAVLSLFQESDTKAKQKFDGEKLTTERAAIDKGRTKFEGIFDEAKHAEAQKQSTWRLSHKALQAALFIILYREEPILQAPHRLLNALMDLDETITRWRLRHAQMAQRMVGSGLGSGGSSGYGYLIQTVEKHRIFTDLFALSGYLIPSRLLPALPESLSKKMGYGYTEAA